MFPPDPNAARQFLGGILPQGQTFVEKVIDKMNSLFQPSPPPAPLESHRIGPQLDVTPSGTQPSDPFFNQQISAQPGLGEHLVRGIAKSGLLGTPDNPMMMPAMVMSPENAQIIQNILRYHLQKNPNLTPGELATKFMQAKNTGLSGIPTSITNPPPTLMQNLRRLTGSMELGGYNWGPKNIDIVGWKDQTPEQNINTLAHEILHSWQDKRYPNFQSSYIKLKPDMSNFAQYEGQKWEVDARKAGSTGEKAIQKFRDIIGGPSNQLDLQTPVTAKDINELMVPRLSKRMVDEVNAPYYGVMKQNIARNLADAAKTAAGTLPSYQRPFTLEDMIMGTNFSARPDLYRELARGIYSGFTGEKYLYDVPRDIRTLKDIILGPVGGKPIP